MEQEKKDVFSYSVRKGLLSIRVVVNRKTDTIYARVERIRWNDPVSGLSDVMFDSLSSLEGKKGSFLGIAKCHPSDEFSVKAGSSLAIDRLLRKCKGYVGCIADKQAMKVKSYFDAFIHGLQKNIPPKPDKETEEE